MPILSTDLVTEFGQWVHAEAGFALSRVEYVLDQSRVFIHLGADFFMRDAYTKARPFALNVWDDDGTQIKGLEHNFDVAGPLCFAGDYLAHGVALPADTTEEIGLASVVQEPIRMLCGPVIARELCQNVLHLMVRKPLFGANVLQSIINLIFGTQVAINEKDIFTLNGRSFYCSFCAGDDC